MKKNPLHIQQLDSKMSAFVGVKQTTTPPTGWIKAIRLALGMSLKQLGNTLSISKQSVASIEKRERDGSITIKALRETAHALEMELVYGFVPKDGTIDALIERKARELATQIVLRTAQTMKLEDQANGEQRIQQAILEKTNSLRNEMPSALWD